jgi:lipopolysaccharide transport system ATP-binding protein
MTREEIRGKFDEIVAFSEIEKFLDTPVKRYSSGMYVRLAFAVAAHLEPEILLIDEVLAVGDASFQKKCLGKMGDVARGGRTVLFVSHNMPMIASLCNQCLLLGNGRLIQSGETRKIVDLYYSNSGAGNGEVDFTNTQRLPGDSMAKLLKARILNSKGEKTSEVRIDESASVEMEYQLLEDNLSVSPNFHIYNSEGICVFVTSDTLLDPLGRLKLKAGIYVARCRIPENFLNDGTYYIGFALTTARKVIVHFYEKDLLLLSVVDPIDGTITRGRYAGPIPGTVRPALQWESRRLS